MEKLSAGKTIGILAVLAVIFMLCSFGIVWEQMNLTGMVEETEDEFDIVTDGGFYNSDIDVKITAPKGAKVYYTFDCNEPSAENGQLYTKPIQLYSAETEQVYVIRAKAYYGDGKESATLTETYFCGNSIAERYNMPVISIAGEPDGLFGYDEGILVPGAMYDAFMEANPGAHPGGGVEANYTMRGAEAEREVSIEIFESDGSRILSQTGGVRVAGELSRLNNNKSLRLYARREYDKQNKFSYDFFGDMYSLENGTLGKKYKRLLLKNSGQDYGYGFIRSELIGSLADKAGFPDTQHSRPACVYINGNYYGCYWLASNYDSQYFENRYGEYDGEFHILEGGERTKTVSDETDEIETANVKEYNEKYDSFAQMDLTVDENYRMLENFLDVENYLQYFAIENYVGNDDWPDANLKTYRYEAGANGYRENSVFDGRYRMLLFDTDYGFGLTFYYDTIGCLVNEMTLDKIMYEKSPLFAALMKREDCREYFVSYTLDLMNGVMSVESVSKEADELHSSHRDELSRMFEVEGLVGGLLLDESSLGMETVEKNIRQIKDYASARPQYVLQDIEEKFNYYQKYKMTIVSDSDSTAVKVNTFYNESGNFTGVYLKEIPVTITPCFEPGTCFDHWLVDGVRYDEEKLTIYGDDIEGDNVEIELVTQIDENAGIMIAAVAAKGHEDYVELVNMSPQSVSTRGYYLSDDEDMYRYALPVMVLKPGETLRLVGKDNDSADSLGQFVLNFNIKQDETLTLTYEDIAVDYMKIPELSKDGVYVRDFKRGICVEQKR